MCLDYNYKHGIGAPELEASSSRSWSVAAGNANKSRRVPKAVASRWFDLMIVIESDKRQKHWRANMTPTVMAMREIIMWRSS
jgi:hypothetical protein